MDHGINYRTHDVVSEVMRLTDKKGVDLVVDSVGGATLQGSILSLGYRGRVSMVGRGRARADDRRRLHADGRQPDPAGRVPGRRDRHATVPTTTSSA